MIGAGMAGLVAAAELSAAGRNVRVLEGRSRIGGRIWTDRGWPDAPIDLGASWIHGLQDGEIADDPLSRWALSLGVETAVTDYENAVVYGVDGQPLSGADQDFLADVAHELERVVEEDTERDIGSIMCSGSIMDAITKRIDPDSLTSERRHLFHAALGHYEHEYGDDLEKLDHRSGFLGDDDFSGRDVLFPRGFDRLVRELASGLDISTDCPVRRIRWTEDGVEVEAGQETLIGSHAIVTLPLGVLKAGRVEFDPPLPAAKREAIDALGFGLLNKCCLRFPSVFWDPAYEMIGHVDTRRGRWLEFLNMRVYTAAPVLVGFNSGSFAREIEGWSDLEIVDSAMEVLKGIYGQGIPRPEDWRITRWASDPFALGAYSHHAVGSGPWHRRALAEPLGDRVFFAGEATAEALYPSVHGAAFSGERAARDLLGH